jgi:predicted transcriptional regulator of viral defense system
MDYQLQVLRLAQRRGFLRARDLDAAGLPRVALTRLVRGGRLTRVDRGLYALPERAGHEHETLALLAHRYPDAVVCLLSALNFHRLTTQLPGRVWLAIDGKARAPRSGYPPMRIVRFSGAGLTSGVEEHRIGSARVRITNVPRTVVDCFQYRNKVGLDVALEALRQAWTERRVTMDELWRYAKLRRVTNVIRPYLESLP